MDCPECGSEIVAFAVPPSAREAAPGPVAALCPSCLALVEADAADESPDFSRVVGSFPEGEAGAAMAVAVGLLAESVVLHRDAVVDLLEAVQDAGEDPWLVLERLAVAGTVQPDADLAKLRRQLDQLWG